MDMNISLLPPKVKSKYVYTYMWIEILSLISLNFDNIFNEWKEMVTSTKNLIFLNNNLNDVTVILIFLNVDS